MVRQDHRKGVRWSYLAVAAVFTVLTLSFTNLWLGISATVFALGAVWDFINELRSELTVNRHRSVETPESRLVTEFAGEYGSAQGWVQIGGPEKRTLAITSAALNRVLARDDVIVLEQAPEWRVPAHLESSRRKLLHHLRSDDMKARLASDLQTGSRCVVVAPVRYSAFMVTNRLAYEEVRSAGHLHLRFDQVGTLDNRIAPLGYSKCSNHIGGDILAVGDGFFYLQWQSGQNLQSKDTYAASGSGSLDWSDVAASSDLISAVKHGLARELCEEMGLKDDHAPDPRDVKIIGYARAVGLGGKPQFFGVARIPDVPVTVRRGERAYVSEIYRVDFDATRRELGILEAMDKHVAEHSRNSTTLLLLFALIRDWLQEPGATEWLLDGPRHSAGP